MDETVGPSFKVCKRGHNLDETPPYVSHRNVTLSNLNGVTHLAEGGAPGADYLAAQWCERHPDVLHYTFPADWERYGRGAGPRRNQSMLDEFHADLLVAFPGGRGTADMVRRAVAAGVKVITA